MASDDLETQRAEMLEGWERASAVWGRKADVIRDWGMPVSVWLVEHLDLQPGERVLELAAGPGDTGFLAAELVRPGGVLVSSDAAEGMLGVARERAARLGLENVDFLQLQLEWIDLPTASVDAVLCRWGVMLVVDPATALGEMRRVLRPGGRCALAVWDVPRANPWLALPGRAVVELGLAPPPEPGTPGPLALAEPGRLEQLLADAGFVAVEVERVDLERRYESVEQFMAETLEISESFRSLHERLAAEQREALDARIAALMEPYRAESELRLPGSSLVALAHA